MARKKNFENSLKRLEEISLEMEKNEISLENSLKLYKEGVTEAKFCSETLRNIKQEVLVLQKDLNDIFKLENFDAVHGIQNMEEY